MNYDNESDFWMAYSPGEIFWETKRIEFQKLYDVTKRALKTWTLFPGRGFWVHRRIDRIYRHMVHVTCFDMCQCAHEIIHFSTTRLLLNNTRVPAEIADLLSSFVLIRKKWHKFVPVKWSRRLLTAELLTTRIEGIYTHAMKHIVRTGSADIWNAMTTTSASSESTLEIKDTSQNIIDGITIMERINMLCVFVQRHRQVQAPRLGNVAAHRDRPATAILPHGAATTTRQELFT